MFKELCEKLGSGKSELIRGWLRDGYRREFPAYRSAALKQEKDFVDLTPEQICEQAGGVVKRKDGIEVCVLPLSESMSQSIPLTMTEKIINFKKRV